MGPIIKNTSSVDTWITRLEVFGIANASCRIRPPLIESTVITYQSMLMLLVGTQYIFNEIPSQ